MFHDLLNEMSHSHGSMGLDHLLHKLEQDGFKVEDFEAALLTGEDLADAWDEYQEAPDHAVNYLETMFGFVFIRNKQNESSTIGLKDRNKLVIAAK